MARSRRRRFPTLSLLLGLALLVAGPLGWGWLQYDLYREEEEILAELKQEGIDHYSERDVFLAQRQGDSAEDMWEIMTESWRSEADQRFPWLRPLRWVRVHGPIPLDLAKRIASLPRVEGVSFLPPPEGAPPGPTLAESGIDLDELARKALLEPDIDKPLPTGRTLVGDELPELESKLKAVWAGRGEKRIADRYAVSIAVGPNMPVGRSIVDGERRKLVWNSRGWSDRFDVSIRDGGRWRGVWHGATDDSLGIHDLPEGPYYYAHYESYPPFVQPEFASYGEPWTRPSMLLAAGVEYAEELPAGSYVVRFRLFDSSERTIDAADRAPRGGSAIHVKTMTLVVRPDLDWCVERGELEYSGTRRVEWLSELARQEDQVVVREQLTRFSDPRSGVGGSAASQTDHAVFDWDLDPEFTADEFSLASAGAGTLGPPRTIPWYRHWYLATALLGLLLTAYALLRIVARRLLARRELRAAMARQAQPSAA
ncbi:MAG TPA: hypothetical protein VGN57_22920 [Pirellulaceae bacterium]|jgi:hypothetical protein|nr:hypothetical protein [Pirellulaceae bacterium]